MSRFNDIVVHEDSETVEIGAGLTWTDVYKHIVPKGINVVGGRIDGVGVAGLTLGGGMCDFFLLPFMVRNRSCTRPAGYSWKTNQYGLTVDTITEFELVLPNGEVKTVTERDEDLWFALKVGSPSYVYGSRATISLAFHTKGWIQQLRELCKVLHIYPIKLTIISY
jgi:FAD/FMN-containing dehydrogenase